MISREPIKSTLLNLFLFHKMYLTLWLLQLGVSKADFLYEVPSARLTWDGRRRLGCGRDGAELRATRGTSTSTTTHTSSYFGTIILWTVYFCKWC